MPRIYLDHAATTPMRPEALAAVNEGMARWANPSSPHAEGRAARAALEDARARIKAALGWEGELIFTSGASEALVLAMSRAKAERRLVSAVEHDAVFRAAPDAEVLPVGVDGEVDPRALKLTLEGKGRPLLAIQSVNSETGCFQPLDAFVAQIREAGGLLLADCAQSAGKYRLPEADFVVVSAHKFGGPPGIGALLVRDLGTLEASGGQEFGYRGGTENLPATLGFAAALAARTISDGAADWIHAIAEAEWGLETAVYDAGGDVIDTFGSRTELIAALAMPGLSAAAQLIRFDQAGFAVSAGSACSSGTLKRSRALAAFGVPPETADRTIRVSFGWNTTPDEIKAFRNAWLEIAADAKARA